MQISAAVVIYISLQTALLAGVRYWLYQDNLRVPAKIMYLVLAAMSALAGALWLYHGNTIGLSFAYFRLILAAVMFMLSCVIIKEPFTKHTLSYAFIMAYDAVLEPTASFLRGILSPTGEPFVFVLCATAVLAITFVPCVRVLKKMIDSLSKLENDRIFGQLCVICFSFVFMNLIFTFPAPGRITLIVLLSRYLMFFGMVGVYAAATRVMQTMRTAADAQADLALTRRRISMQQSYYDRMLAQVEDVRRMRHDLRHHRAALSALIKNGDIAALSEYINATDSTEESVTVSGNLVCDSMLLYFSDIAKKQGITIETRLSVGQKMPLSDPDLCIILGNLLENAVDAQKHLPEEKRFIRVTVKGDGESLTLAVDNRFDGTLLCENDAYISRKAEGGHGIGIASVRAICEKYGGILQIETDGDMFMTGLVIGV